MRSAVYLDDKIGVQDFIPRPLYSEEWRISDNRIWYDSYLSGDEKHYDAFTEARQGGRYQRLIPEVPAKMLPFSGSEEFDRRGANPYGQYIVSLNMLPSDEEHVLNNIQNGNRDQTLDFAYNKFMRLNILNEENQTLIMKQRMDKSQVHSQSQDWVSPYMSK